MNEIKPRAEEAITTTPEVKPAATPAEAKSMLKKNHMKVNIWFILIVLVLAGAVGGYVLYTQHQNVSVYDALTNGVIVSKHAKKVVAKPTPAPAPTPPADPTASWPAFSSKTGIFSLKHPTAWTSLTCDNDATVFLAGDPAAKAVCGSENVGQMEVDSSAGDNSASRKYANQVGSITTATVTISGVSCTMQTGVDTTDGMGSVKGTKLAQYICVTAGRTYVAAYSQSPTQKDFLTDFETMATKTLKFSS